MMFKNKSGTHGAKELNLRRALYKVMSVLSLMILDPSTQELRAGFEHNLVK